MRKLYKHCKPGARIQYFGKIETPSRVKVTMTGDELLRAVKALRGTRVVADATPILASNYCDTYYTNSIDYHRGSVERDMVVYIPIRRSYIGTNGRMHILERWCIKAKRDGELIKLFIAPSGVFPSGIPANLLPMVEKHGKELIERLSWNNICSLIN